LVVQVDDQLDFRPENGLSGVENLVPTEANQVGQERLPAVPVVPLAGHQIPVDLDAAEQPVEQEVLEVVADVVDEIADALLGPGDEVLSDGHGVIDDAPEHIADAFERFPEGVGVDAGPAQRFVAGLAALVDEGDGRRHLGIRWPQIGIGGNLLNDGGRLAFPAMIFHLAMGLLGAEAFDGLPETALGMLFSIREPLAGAESGNGLSQGPPRPEENGVAAPGLEDVLAAQGEQGLLDADGALVPLLASLYPIGQVGNTGCRVGLFAQVRFVPPRA
jgi:hypothetical protein